MLDHTRTRTYRFRCVHCGATKLTTQVSSSLLRLEIELDIVEPPYDHIDSFICVSCELRVVARRSATMTPKSNPDNSEQRGASTAAKGR